MRVVVECGQRWWRPRSWRRHESENRLHYRRLRAKDRNGRSIGFAVGPLMFVRKRVS